MAEKSPRKNTARHEGDRTPLVSADELAKHLEEFIDGSKQTEESEVGLDNQAIAASSDEEAAQDQAECLDANQNKNANANPLLKYRRLRGALEEEIPKQPEVTLMFYKVQICSDVQPNFTSVTSFQDGRILLTDFCCSLNSGFVSLYSAEIILRAEKRFQSLCFSAAPIDVAHVVVSLPRARVIQIMAVSDESMDMRIVKTHRFRFKPWIVAGLTNGDVAVAWSEPFAFSITDISGDEAVHRIYLTKDNKGRDFESFGYFALDEDRRHVIQPCAITHAVFCFDFEGTPVFQYKADNLLHPEGITLDSSGKIYVCDFKTATIHKISAAGEPIVVLSENIPPHPRAICLDRNGCGLWLTHVNPETGHMLAHLTIKY